jgi:tetratricopeptide (TPR) repeat protein
MYTVREVAAVLGCKPGRLRSYLRAGFISPTRGERGELRFSFQDLALLRKAEGLVTQRIPPRSVHHALRSLRRQLGEAPLSGVQLAAEGRAVVVTDGARRWDPTSGQVLLDFTGGPGAVPAEAGALHELRQRPPRTERPPVSGQPQLSADEHYEQGFMLEESDPKGAIEHYRRAVERDPAHADAHVNLGRLLHEGGSPFDALTHYRAALSARPSDATAAFNLGVALEDLGRLGEAVEAYQGAIAIEGENADAHYNLARLFEQSGKPEAAIRHLLIYRQLTRKRK